MRHGVDRRRLGALGPGGSVLATRPERPRGPCRAGSVSPCPVSDSRLGPASRRPSPSWPHGRAEPAPTRCPHGLAARNRVAGRPVTARWTGHRPQVHRRASVYSTVHSKGTLLPARSFRPSAFATGPRDREGGRGLGDTHGTSWTRGGRSTASRI